MQAVVAVHGRPDDIHCCEAVLRACTGWLPGVPAIPARLRPDPVPFPRPPPQRTDRCARPGRIRALIAISAGYSANRPDSAVPYPLGHAYWYDRRGFCRYLSIPRLTPTTGA
ncbi:hypothetical protein ACWCQS_22465 [Streptomyces sp. NPDC002076]